jgi:GrpB-like predicted nucleotidyltransferase (UPF0157 family)
MNAADSRLAGVILVVEYDPTWPQLFEQLRQEYTEAMTAARVPVVAIEHVGSTSVPGLAAKPVIDCDIVVAEQDVDATSQILTELGFKPLGELGIPLRWAFKEPERLAGTNTYVVVEGSLSLRNHLAVRNTLRTDANLRQQYAAVKRCAGATAANIDDYGRRKNAMVQQILSAPDSPTRSELRSTPTRYRHTTSFPGKTRARQSRHQQRQHLYLIVGL